MHLQFTQMLNSTRYVVKIQINFVCIKFHFNILLQVMNDIQTLLTR